MYREYPNCCNPVTDVALVVARFRVVREHNPEIRSAVSTVLRSQDLGGCGGLSATAADYLREIASQVTNITSNHEAGHCVGTRSLVPQNKTQNI
jgi:hypothetical protein